MTATLSVGEAGQRAVADERRHRVLDRPPLADSIRNAWGWNGSISLSLPIQSLA